MLSQDEDGRTKLYVAAKNNKIEEAKKMIERANNLNIASELVNKGNNDGETPLFQTSFILLYYGYLQMAELLLNNGAEVDKANIYGVTPLILASALGRLEVVNLLIEHQADVHLKNDDGKTALHYARREGYTAIEKALRKAGAK